MFNPKRYLVGHCFVADKTDKPLPVIVGQADDGKAVAAYDFGNIQEEQLYLLIHAGDDLF